MAGELFSGDFSGGAKRLAFDCAADPAGRTGWLGQLSAKGLAVEEGFSEGCHAPESRFASGRILLARFGRGESGQLPHFVHLPGEEGLHGKVRRAVEGGKSIEPC